MDSALYIGLNRQQRAAWFADDNFKVDGQNVVWKAATLIKEGKNRSACCAEFHAIFLAMVKELNNGKTPMF